jgi:hypothetical protein
MAETTTGAIGIGKPIAIAGESRRAYEKRVAAWAKAQAQVDWQVVNPQAAKTGKAYTWASVPARIKYVDTTALIKVEETVERQMASLLMGGGAYNAQLPYFCDGVARTLTILRDVPGGLQSAHLAAIKDRLDGMQAVINAGQAVINAELKS